MKGRAISANCLQSGSAELAKLNAFELHVEYLWVSVEYLVQVARAIGEENVLQSQAANSLVSLGDCGCCSPLQLGQSSKQLTACRKKLWNKLALP